MEKHDFIRLIADINSIAKEIWELKKEIRKPRYSPTWQQWHQLNSLKSKATILCSIRADLGGKLHQLAQRVFEKGKWVTKPWTMEQQKALIQPHLLLYNTMAPVPASQPPEQKSS